MILKLEELDISGRKILIREDLNVPIRDGRITSEARLEAALPTLRLALDAGASVLVASHLGRPEEGRYTAEFSLAPVAGRLASMLGMEVPLISDPVAQASRRTCSAAWAA